MPNFAALEKKKTQLIRKALGGSLFLAPLSAAKITTITGSDSSLAALPTGWTDGGLLSDDGVAWSRSVDQSEISSFGRTEPSRTDITSDVENVEVTFQETSKLTISAFTGADPTGLVPDASTGELSIPKALTPASRRYQLLGLAVDKTDAGEIYIARYLPRAVVTDFGDQAYAKGDDPIQWNVTLKAESDQTLGYAIRHIFGGPGWKAQLADAGFGS